MEHFRTLRSSTTLPLYLTISILCSCWQLRTYHLIGLDASNPIFFTAFGIANVSKMVLLVLEHANKRRMLVKTYGKTPNPEDLAPFFSRITLFWFSHYLFLGAKGSMGISDLGAPESEIVQLYKKRFDQAWGESQHRSHPLLRALIKSMGKDLLSPTIPTLMYSLTAMAAPLLLKAVLAFIDSWQHNADGQPVQIGWLLAAGTYSVSF